MKGSPGENTKADPQYHRTVACGRVRQILEAERDGHPDPGTCQAGAEGSGIPIHDLHGRADFARQGICWRRSGPIAKEQGRRMPEHPVEVMTRPSRALHANTAGIMSSCWM